MNLGLLKEPSDNRVALLPENIKSLVDLGLKVFVESGAGRGAFTEDSFYVEFGARVCSQDELIKNSDFLIKIHPPENSLVEKIPPGKTLVCLLNPRGNQALLESLAKKGIHSLALDAIPRISRAQSMDVLSSQACVAGYKAVLLAATHLPRFFPMLTTAAGSIPPARVLVLGAGVAGLQAIATAKRLGAKVFAFDVRSAVKEEVKSLGATFVEVEGASDDKASGGYAVEQTEEFQKKQKALIKEHCQNSQVVICTAQIPGRQAPVLVDSQTVLAMKPGSVIIDLASSSGGNCSDSVDNKTIVKNGVTILGDSNLPSSVPLDSSKMFGKNLVTFFKAFLKEGQFQWNFEDEILKGCCVTYNGENRLKK